MGRAKKPKRLQATYIEGKPYCPQCKTRHWDVIKGGLADNNEHGMFKFEGKCRDCGNIIIYCNNI